jgi:phage FluMu protein Com
MKDKAVAGFTPAGLPSTPKGPSAPEGRKLGRGRGGTYEAARCAHCGAVYVTWVKTELHGDVVLFMECPRCGEYDYELIEVPESAVERMNIIKRHYLW